MSPRKIQLISTYKSRTAKICEWAIVSCRGSDNPKKTRFVALMIK